MSDAVLFREHEVEEVEDWPECVDQLGKSTLLWVDLEHPDADQLERLADGLDLDPRSVRRLEGEAAPSLTDFGSYLHVTGSAPRGESHELERLDCLVSTPWVVTVRDGPVKVVDELRERAEGGGEVGRLDGVEFLADLLTWILEGYLRAFEAIDIGLLKSSTATPCAAAPRTIARSRGSWTSERRSGICAGRSSRTAASCSR